MVATGCGGGPFDVGSCMNPFVVVRGDDYRMFYCGNGYGATGIGTAVAEPIA